MSKRARTLPAPAITQPPPPDADGPDRHPDPARAFARPLALQLCRQAVWDWGAATADRDEGYRRYDAWEAAHPDAPVAEVREWERWLDAATSPDPTDLPRFVAGRFRDFRYFLARA